ncbi:unnamed protein product [Echinostoma caproni]|uniref:RING-type domain-containing protein n=1 Tax=Echinostoma caproni TaxID=27848 RepID=A0A183AUW9_9TREM|nr:unnamed protein product [Echinostoma caproni]
MGKTEPKADQEEEAKPSTPESDQGKENRAKKEKKDRPKKKPVKSEDLATDTNQPDDSVEGTPKKPTKKRAKSAESKSKKHKAKTDPKAPDTSETRLPTQNSEDLANNSVSVVEPTGTPAGSVIHISAGVASAASCPGSMISLSSLSARDTGEIVFIDELDAIYRCIICGHPLRVPILFQDCGHHCCSGCLPNILRGSSRCPSDNTYLKQDHIRMDKDFQLQMDNLAVRCTYCARGCSWTGKLAQLGSHLSHCGFRVIVCPNGCGVEFEVSI